MAGEKKKVTCLDCGKEVELTDKGKCPNCGLKMRALLERLRHEKALEKLRKQQNQPEEIDDDDDEEVGLGF